MSQLDEAPDASAGESAADPVWNCAEIERLYRQALDAVEAVADDLDLVSATLSDESESEAAETTEATGSESGTVGLSSAAAAAEMRPDPVQVIEALLFVGGQP